ncbi:MAG: hypothetical protein GXP14_16410 [Gammaproteobacteria bacterium]|nr:hypothetical protein [Gammaproteobacteria bacterium]
MKLKTGTGSDTAGLGQLCDAFYAPGDAIDIGCTREAFQHYWDQAHAVNGDKPVTAVEHWTWWDLILPDDFTLPEPLLPAIIKADRVFTSSGCFNPGDWVRTTLLIRFHEPCLFETRNSIYVLMGPGTRKSVDPETAMAFF